MSPKKKRSLPAWMKSPTDCSSSSQSCPTSSSTKSPKAKQSIMDRHITDTLSDDETDEARTNCHDISDSHKTEDLVNGSNNITQNNSTSDLGATSVDAKKDEESSSSAFTRSVTPDSISATTTMNTPILVTNGMNSPTTRNSCYYGSSCYRKNPQHRTDFAHPGDSDFSECTSRNTGGSPTNDSRPLCHFGTACYRKNPQHWRDFRHDAPQKRKARPTDLQDISSDNDGDFDASFGSDDYNPGCSETDDSFVTSDSMDSGESDFDPEDEEENEKKTKKRQKKDRQTNKKRAKKD